jgi:acetyltransferase-like isoleucine patch superfamily enzyme
LRKSVLAFCHKLNVRVAMIYTWLLRSSLKSCGVNTTIYCPVRLQQPGLISLGANVLLYPRVWINVVSEWAGVKYDGAIQIGDRVSISYDVQISAAQSIIIEDDVTIASGAVIVDHFHDYRHVGTPIFTAPLSKPSPVRIGKRSFLGVHCFIGPGVQIGEQAMVAANAVVMKDVPAYAIAAGNPARMYRYHLPESGRRAKVDLSGANYA